MVVLGGFYIGFLGVVVVGFFWGCGVGFVVVLRVLWMCWFFGG